MLCQGDAGVGKTYTVKALKEIISSKNKMLGLAPSAAAAAELSKEANINCQSLDVYLNIPIKSLLKHELIVVDEAGMISSTQIKNLLERGIQTNSRILLIGDTKQVRQGLIEQKKLSGESRNIDILKSKDLDKFSLTQASSYQTGDVIKFGHTTAKFNKDLYYRVDAIDSKNKTLILRDSLDNKQDLELNTYLKIYRVSCQQPVCHLLRR